MLGPTLLALEFTVNVMVFADVVTVPDPEEAVSQLGVVIEYFTLPKVALRAERRGVPAMRFRTPGGISRMTLGSRLGLRACWGTRDGPAVVVGQCAPARRERSSLPSDGE